MERVDRRTVLPARVATFTERKRVGDMPKGVVEDKAGVAEEPNKNNNEEENASPMPYRHLGKSEYRRERRKS
jgi:hypothetical protein